MLRKNYSTQRKNLCTKLLKNSKISYFENFDTQKLQITEVFKGLSYYYLPILFTQNSSKGEEINLINYGKTISSEEELHETCNQFFF